MFGMIKSILRNEYLGYPLPKTKNLPYRKFEIVYDISQAAMFTKNEFYRTLSRSDADIAHWRFEPLLDQSREVLAGVWTQANEILVPRSRPYRHSDCMEDADVLYGLPNHNALSNAGFYTTHGKKLNREETKDWLISQNHRLYLAGSILTSEDIW